MSSTIGKFSRFFAFVIVPGVRSIGFSDEPSDVMTGASCSRVLSPSGGICNPSRAH